GGAVIQDEAAQAVALGQVPDGVGATLAGIALGDRRQGLGYRRDPIARLLLAARISELEVNSLLADDTQGKLQPRRRALLSGPSHPGGRADFAAPTRTTLTIAHRFFEPHRS